MTESSDEPGVEAGIARHGKLSYMQIPASDPAALAAFYTAVFGWECGEGTEHVSFRDTTGELIGAFVTSLSPAPEGGVLPYVYVHDVAAIVSAIQARGGRLERAPYPEGALTVATFRDPAGNVMGVWQA